MKCKICKDKKEIEVLVMGTDTVMVECPYCKNEIEYRVITLYEPWATLVVHGIKKIETRPKATSWTSEKGIYLIHAAKKLPDKTILSSEPFISEFRRLRDKCFPDNVFHFGHIIGYIEVGRCIEITNDSSIDFALSGNEYLMGDYGVGRFMWFLHNPQVLKTPIPYTGNQGYYNKFDGDKIDLSFIR